MAPRTSDPTRIRLWMRFLQGARITDFRSIAHANVEFRGDVTPLVGLNGSGKSNFLRALNLFFNDVLETDDPLSLRRDFREPGRKVKLRVAVEVDLDYSVFEGLRKDFQESLNQLAEGYGVITFRKEWTLHPVTRDQVMTLYAGPLPDELAEVEPERLPYATRLLRLVRYRYIPNHIHPSRILQDEQEGIRKLLFDRLSQQQVFSDDTVKQIASGAADLMAPIRDAMSEATGEIGAVELATPSDWRELVWAFGLRMQASQTQSFEALLHGSGMQSVLAYQVLHTIDTTFSGSFGWRKGAIWAVEEPESFLHARLQGELARRLGDYASGPELQILLSTHSPAFLGTASDGLIASMDPSGRSEFELKPRRDVIRLAYSSGAAPFAHPLHTGPPKPLLLVEGKNDRDLINRAYQVNGPNPYEVLCLEYFDSSLTGGSQIPSWLRFQRGALEARPETSPVFILLDWEVKDAEVAKIQKELDGHPTSRAFRWPEDLTNQELSSNWVGIEKFLSTTVVEHLRDEGVIELLAPVSPHAPIWKYSIDKKKLLDAKSHIHTLLDERDSDEDLRPLIDAISWLSSHLSASPPLL